MCLKSATKIIGLCIITRALVKNFTCRKTEFYQPEAIVNKKFLFRHMMSAIHTNI